MPARPDMGLAAWLASDDTGWSSRYLAGALCGFPCEFAYPHDPDDLGRCVRMLEAVPAARELFGTLAGLPEPWPTLSAHWTELVTLYEFELAGRRPLRLYDRMKELYKPFNL